MNKQTLKIIEIISSIFSLLSKIAVSMSSVIGWPLAVLGYILVATYNFKQKYTILATTSVGLALMCAYGWYKWVNSITELQIFDYTVMVLTAIFAGIIYFIKIKKGGLLDHLQAIVTITALTAWLLIGFKIYIYGWVFMLITHFILVYLYSKKKAYFYVTLQIFSITVAVIKIITLL